MNQNNNPTTTQELQKQTTSADPYLAKYQKQELATFSQLEPATLPPTDAAIIRAAFASPQIIATPENEREKRLRVVLLNLSVLFRVKEENLPSPEAVALLLAQLEKHHRTTTFSEITEAAELAAAGKLLQADGKKLEPFQLIDFAFVSDLIRAYQLEKQAAFIRYRQKQQQTKRLAEPPPMSNKQAHDGLVNFIDENKRLPDVWNWSAVYDYLLESKQVPETFEELQAFRAEKVKELEADINYRILTETKGITDIYEKEIKRQQLEQLKGEAHANNYVRKCYVRKKFANLCQNSQPNNSATLFSPENLETPKG